MIRVYLLFKAVCLLSLNRVSGRLNDVDLDAFDVDVRRREQQDLFCSDGQLRELYANIDIMIEDIGSGCEDSLFDIGQVLQDVVSEVEEDIPMYENERMETTICPYPVIEKEGEFRLLRETSVDLEERKLRKKKKKKKKPTRTLTGTQRYRYRGGVKCQRCLQRLNNSDRRLQYKACDNADVAEFAADMAATAVENAGKAFDYLKEKAIECDDLQNGAEFITNAKILVQQCREGRRLASNKAKIARLECEEARNAGPLSQIQKHEKLAETASNEAINAARNTKRRYILLRDSLGNNVCSSQARPGSSSSVSVDQVCRESDIAQFGYLVSATAAKNAAECFKDLRQRALECDDLLRLQELVTDARKPLEETRKAMKVAKNGERIANAQCNQARKADSSSELAKYMQVAERASEDSLREAEEARVGYLLIKNELEQLDECKIVQSPIAPAVSETSSQETEPPDAGQEFEDETIYEQTLRDWLVLLARSLYDMLPKRLMEEYEQATFPKGCKVSGFDVKIRIDVLESSQELVFWVTEDTCDEIQS